MNNLLANSFPGPVSDVPNFAHLRCPFSLCCNIKLTGIYLDRIERLPIQNLGCLMQRNIPSVLIHAAEVE